VFCLSRFAFAARAADLVSDHDRRSEGDDRRRLLAGAALATYPAWGYGGYGYGYGGGGGGCWQYRPTYDGYGNPLGQSWVNLC